MDLTEFKQQYQKNPQLARGYLVANKSTLREGVVQAKHEYELGISPLTDAQYDFLESVCKSLFPNWTPPVGVLSSNQQRVALPYWMGSLDKVMLDAATPTEIEKTQVELAKWTRKYGAMEYVVEPKLDGISCLLHIQNATPKLYTRGDGRTGADITDRIGKICLGVDLRAILDKLGPQGELAVRGELVFPKSLFVREYAQEFSNPRNFVAGLISNQKVSPTLLEGLKHVHFIAYEIVQSEAEPPLDQLNRLMQLGFTTIPFTSVKRVQIQNSLLPMLEEYTQRYDFLVDGLVISANRAYRRNISKNPTYAIAFKLQSAPVVVRVVEVVWEISRYGKYAPRLRIPPTVIEDKTIRFVTAHNASKIIKEGIGPGAQIEIRLSGQVISKIERVLQPAPAGPSLPPGVEGVDWAWNESGVDIVSLREIDGSVKQIYFFLSKMGAKNIGEATVQKLYDAGYNDLWKILDLTKATTLPAIPYVAMQRTVESLQQMLDTEVDLVRIVVASGLLPRGIGERKLELLLHAVPEFFTVKTLDLSKLPAIAGLSASTLEEIYATRTTIQTFLSKYKKYARYVSPTAVTSTAEEPVVVSIAFSGFRDADLKAKLERTGKCKICESVSGKTKLLVVADPSATSEKVKKAAAKGIPIVSKDHVLEYVDRF